MDRLPGHPNTVTMLHAGATTPAGRPFPVMPYHARCSLDTQIREPGPLSIETAFWIGVKIAGASRVRIGGGFVHRDVKPGNIVLSDYGEPALSDFGIARIAVAFRAASGRFGPVDRLTGVHRPGSARRGAPTVATDVYGSGATLFCALTGHTAFEVCSGENVVTQFLRITTQLVPVRRDSGIAEDVPELVALAISRDRRQRPSAAALGETIRQAQRRHGFVVEMALQSEQGLSGPDSRASGYGVRPPAAESADRRYRVICRSS